MAGGDEGRVSPAEHVRDRVETRDVVAPQAVDDHWSAKADLDRRDASGRSPRGVASFTPEHVASPGYPAEPVGP